MPSPRPFAHVVKLLSSNGLRPTRQRMALARILFENGNRHLTAEHLHDEAQRSNVRVSLATIYNALHQFTEAGLLREVVVDPGRSYFDTNISDHHHFYFEDRCELEDIPGDMVTVSQLPLPPAGTSIRRVEVIVRIATQSD